MMQKLVTNSLLVLGLVAGLLTGPGAAAQPAIKMSSLLVEVWPEYDRPEALVIFRGELHPDTPLPAQLTFKLPAHITEMNAVAVHDETGALINADPASMQIRTEGDVTLLTFTTPSLQMQFEYYDPQILTKNGQERQLSLAFTAPYDLDSTIFEVQEPAQTTNFSMTPPPTNTFSGNDGLTYNTVEAAGLRANESLAINGTYQRPTDALSRPNPGEEKLSGSLPDPPAAGGSGFSLFSAENFSIGYILIGAGILLLLGTGGYWWWSNSRAGAEPARRGPGKKADRRPARPAKQAAHPRPTTSSGPGQPAGYCHRCGAALRPDGNFCHVCGAERRRG
jgi:hypothetical protein